MANNTVKILIETLYKGQGTKQAADDLKDLGKGGGNLSTLKAGFSSLATGVGIATGAIAAFGLAANKALEIGAEGAQVARLEASFQSLASVAGESGDEILAALDRAAQGTVSNTDLILSANRAMMLGLGADADQLAQLLEVAAFRGRALGLSTTQAFNDIVTGIGRASPLILDNLGIITKGWDEQAKAAGVAMDSQFIFNKVLEDGAAQMKEAGGLVDDTAATYERLNAAWKDGTDQGKKYIGEVLKPTAEWLTKVIELQTLQSQGLREGQGIWEARVSAAIEYNGALEEAASNLDGWGRELSATTPALEANTDATAENADALKALSDAYKGILSSASALNREEERYIEDANERSVRLHEIEQEKVRLQMEQNGVQAAGNLTLEKRNDFMLKQIELDNEYNQILADGVQAEEDRQKAANKRIFDMALEQAAMDGLSSAEYERFQNLQVQLGLVTRADADRAIAERQSADEFAAALSDQTTEVTTLQDALDNIPSKSPYRAQIVIETVGGIPTLESVSQGPTLHPSVGGGGDYLGGYAEGGSFVVPGAGTGDRPYMLGLTPGERVTVSPKGEGAPVVNINIANIRSLSDIDYLAQEVERRIAR